MKVQNSTFFSIAMLFVQSAASFGQQVKTDYDHDANFEQYKTYSWEKVQTRDPLLVDRIKDAVNGALAAKGWTQVESGGDVSVVAMEITQNQQTLNTFYDGFGGGLALGRIRRRNDDNGNLQGRHPSRRSVRRQDQEFNLARLVQRHTFQQCR